MRLKETTKRHGQVLVFYALMIPIFLICSGVILDLGWYYLNVSRLQNAADAAAVAGAQEIIKDTTNFSDYFQKIRLVHQYPANPENKYDVDSDTKKETLTSGNESAVSYALKNLSSDATATNIPVGVDTDYTMTSNWSNGGDPRITMRPRLYKDRVGNLYYVVSMTEKIRHLFIRASVLMGGVLEDMDAPVVAVAMLTKVPRDSGVGVEHKLPEGTNILFEMYKVEDRSVIRNWEWQDWYSRDELTYQKTNPGGHKELKGTTVHPNETYLEMTGGIDIYREDWAAFERPRVQYTLGEHYRYETVTVKPGSSDQVKVNGVKVGEDKVDSINLECVFTNV